MVKALGNILGLLRALPILLGYALGRVFLDQMRAFSAASERASRIPGFVGIYTRQAFYRRTLARVGGDAHFGFMSVFSKPAAVIGHRVYIGRFCTIGWADLGDDVMLADGVQILSGGHQHSAPSPPSGEGEEEGPKPEAGPLRDNPLRFSKVTIGAGAWIGAGAIIMADVGAGAVVAAGAVVVKPIAAGERVGGVPAKPLSA
jgi:acetyltransferase-like isoleucine patch superfamily enzyme